MPLKTYTTNHSLPAPPTQKGNHDQRGPGRDKTLVVKSDGVGKSSREI